MALHSSHVVKPRIGAMRAEIRLEIIKEVVVGEIGTDQVRVQQVVANHKQPWILKRQTNPNNTKEQKA